MAEKEVFYEMLWDCAQCNTTGLLGDSHRHCPTCGAPQDPAKRYFPQQGEEQEAKDHQFVGADWRCAYCDSPNSASAAHCTNCGAGQDGTKPVAIVVDPAAAPQPALAIAMPPAAPGSKRWLWALALLALVLVGLGILFTRTHEATASVTARTWQRDIQIEQFAAGSESAWCDSMPSGAYAVRQSTEQRSTRQVQDGEVCRDERIDKGDGTFVKQRQCTPRYRSQPVYDQRCRFQINRWRTVRTATTGSETSPVPVWPSVQPDKGALAGAGNSLSPALGTQREGARSENYVLLLQSGDQTSSCAVPFEVWNKYQAGASLSIRVRMTGGTDCSSLQ